MTNPRMLETTEDGWRGRFKAMASPCEVQLRDAPHATARQVMNAVSDEAWRVERAFSRYRDDNLVYAVNQAAGQWVDVDAEFERLLDFADTCYRVSDGRFDITSGVLRRVWCFDGSDQVPDEAAIEQLLPLVGWHQVERQPGRVRLAPGMEIDFGGIGKEYAVDRALFIARQCHDGDVLVNFGGDIAALSRDLPWRVGLESLSGNELEGTFELRNGGLATSGDTRRFLMRDGIRYGHVLDPLTGWPVKGGPHSITVAAGHCTQAGMLATLALLHGEGAERFLSEQKVRHWCVWDSA